MSTGTKLIMGGAVIAAVTGYMAYLGAASSWQYYLTADECAADSAALVGRPLRVSGRVAPGSLEINADRTEASFVLKGMQQTIPVVCSGPLPDNLVEDVDVVVEGRMKTAMALTGDKVLTRCASKYESNERRAAAQTGAVAGLQTEPRGGPAGSGDPRRTGAKPQEAHR